MTRVFLVDDHELVRHGIAGVINAESDLEIVGEAGTVRAAIGRIGATRPEIAILDVRLPDGSGVDLCREVLSRFPEVRCIMLTAYDDDAASEAAVLAGASGYVLKDIRGGALVDAIRRVAAGQRLIAPSVAPKVVERIAERTLPDDTPALSAREQQVLALIAEGLTNREIGARLHLAEKTVKNYVSGLLLKLGLKRRTQAAIYVTRGELA